MGCNHPVHLRVTPGVDLRAFVDGWGLLFGSVLDFPHVVSGPDSCLDLALDMNKNRVWSSDSR